MRYTLCLLIFLTANLLWAQTTSLKDTTNQYDYVVITLPDFVDEFANFKQHKESVRGLKTIVTDTSQIFSEFDSEATFQANLRAFISYAGTKWKPPQPKYFLIAGDRSAIPNYSFLAIPGSDEFGYAHSDYKYTESVYDSDTLMFDFYVGRIAARNRTELSNYLAKVIEYESDNEIHQWNNRVLLAAAKNEHDLFEDMAFNFAERLPNYINPVLIFENDTSDYFGNTDSLVSKINKGAGFVGFIGHGIDSQFTQEEYFELQDVAALNNDKKPFLFYLMEKQSFSTDTSTSMVDLMLFSQNGAIGSFQSVGAIYVSQNNSFLRTFLDVIYNKNTKIIAEAADSSIKYKLNQFSTIKYNIFGDPSLKVKYDVIAGNKEPEPSIVKDYILSQNYPNPFNPSTTISFQLPKAEHVNLEVSNVLKQKVRTLIDSEVNSGYHEVKFDGAKLSSGIYIYMLKAGNFTAAKKMILAK